MTSSNHLKALLRSHLEGDNQRFYSVAMQIAAHEAKMGHGKFAEEIRLMIDDAKKKAKPPGTQPIPISRPRGELGNLLTVSYPASRLGEMVMDKVLSGQLQRIIREQRHASNILAHGLTPRRKLLLIGPPGTGKTMSASVLAGELGLPLLQVRLDGLITKYMGETAAKLRQIFDATDQTRGVYFFDEFDSIGSQRGLSNDVGEIGRVLNSFLQMIEQDGSHSLIIAATNHPEILDHALFRRFDDILHYDLPDGEKIISMLKSRLADRVSKRVSWKKLSGISTGLSYAEITRAADEVLKAALIQQREKITEADIRDMLIERQNMAQRLKGSAS